MTKIKINHDALNAKWSRFGFYQDFSVFRRRLAHVNTNSQGNCCGCKAQGVPTTFFNLKKEFGSLKLKTKGLPDFIHVCLCCGTTYMNSFNRALAAVQGRKYEGNVWEEYDTTVHGDPIFTRLP